MNRPHTVEGVRRRKEELRKKHYKDSMGWENKYSIFASFVSHIFRSRFGLFSYIPYSIGENTYDKKVKRRKKGDGSGQVPIKSR